MGVARVEKKPLSVCALISRLVLRGEAYAKSRLQPINGDFSIFLLDVAFVISVQTRGFEAVYNGEITNDLQQ